MKGVKQCLLRHYSYILHWISRSRKYSGELFKITIVHDFFRIIFNMFYSLNKYHIYSNKKCQSMTFVCLYAILSLVVHLGVLVYCLGVSLWAILGEVIDSFISTIAAAVDAAVRRRLENLYCMQLERRSWYLAFKLSTLRLVLMLLFFCSFPTRCAS